MDDEKPDTLKREQFEDVDAAGPEEDDEPNETLEMVHGEDGGIAWLVRVSIMFVLSFLFNCHHFVWLGRKREEGD